MNDVDIIDFAQRWTRAEVEELIHRLCAETLPDHPMCRRPCAGTDQCSTQQPTG